MHMTSVSMDLKQIYLRLQLYFPFERKKTDVPRFPISMVSLPSRASQTKRGVDTDLGPGPWASPWATLWATFWATLWATLWATPNFFFNKNKKS